MIISPFSFSKKENSSVVSWSSPTNEPLEPSLAGIPQNVSGLITLFPFLLERSLDSDLTKRPPLKSFHTSKILRLNPNIPEPQTQNIEPSFLGSSFGLHWSPGYTQSQAGQESPGSCSKPDCYLLFQFLFSFLIFHSYLWTNIN